MYIDEHACVLVCMCVQTTQQTECVLEETYFDAENLVSIFYCWKKVKKKKARG